MKIGNIEVYGVIYKITNMINGKCYIGQTVVGFDRRYSGGLENTHNEHLKKSIQKYGIENFEIIKMFDVAFSKVELDIKETMYIDFFDSINPNKGYNKSTGGANPLPSEESKLKRSKTLMGHKVSDKTKQKLSEKAKLRIGENNSFYGKQHSDETKQKISDANKGRKWSEESKIQMSKNRKGRKSPMDGKHHSEETKRKISENHAFKGKERPEISEKMSGKNNPNAKTVICITTNKIFNTAIEATKYYGINQTGVVDCCKGRQKSAGKLPDGTKLVWKYITIIEL